MLALGTSNICAQSQLFSEAAILMVRQRGICSAFALVKAIAWSLETMILQQRSKQAALPAVREFAHKSAAFAASPDYLKFQAVIKSAASAASLRGGRASGDWITAIFSQTVIKILDSAAWVQ